MEYIEFESSLSSNTNTETVVKEEVKTVPLPEVMDFSKDEMDESFTADRGSIFSDEEINERFVIIYIYCFIKQQIIN